MVKVNYYKGSGTCLKTANVTVVPIPGDIVWIGRDRFLVTAREQTFEDNPFLEEGEHEEWTVFLQPSNS